MSSRPPRPYRTKPALIAMKTLRSNLTRDASNFDDYMMLVATIALFAGLVVL